MNRYIIKYGGFQKQGRTHWCTFASTYNCFDTQPHPAISLLTVMWPANPRSFPRPLLSEQRKTLLNDPAGMDDLDHSDSTVNLPTSTLNSFCKETTYKLIYTNLQSGLWKQYQNSDWFMTQHFCCSFCNWSGCEISGGHTHLRLHDPKSKSCSVDFFFVSTFVVKQDTLIPTSITKHYTRAEKQTKLSQAIIVTPIYQKNHASCVLCVTILSMKVRTLK